MDGRLDTVPVVLVEVGGVARSGHYYGDRTGYEYEYPAGRYERLIQPGERFVYQVPGSGYTGTGVIGRVRSAGSPGRLVCEILSSRMFVEPVPLRAPGGYYYEADTQFWRDKVYWGQGVRPLSNARLDEIVAASDDAVDISDDLVTLRYASPEDASAVERLSVAAAIEAIRVRFGAPVMEMHHNNPGFDLMVGSHSDPIRYVEVKGTRSSAPRFFMSEGERQFSARNAAHYTLAVVYGVDLIKSSVEGLVMHDGEVSGDRLSLVPTQWTGSLTIPSP